MEDYEIEKIVMSMALLTVFITIVLAILIYQEKI